MVRRNRYRVKVTHLERRYNSTYIHKPFTGTTQLGLETFLKTTTQSEVLLLVVPWSTEVQNRVQTKTQ